MDDYLTAVLKPRCPKFCAKHIEERMWPQWATTVGRAPVSEFSAMRFNIHTDSKSKRRKPDGYYALLGVPLRWDRNRYEELLAESWKQVIDSRFVNLRIASVEDTLSTLNEVFGAGWFTKGSMQTGNPNHIRQLFKTGNPDIGFVTLEPYFVYE